MATEEEKKIDTQAEKKEQIAALERQIAALEAKMKEQDDKIFLQADFIDRMKEKDEGFLITTPNICYDGVTAGILFRNGCAFIRKNDVLPRFVVEPPPESRLQQYSEEQQARILETCKMPSAERAMITLTRDFGYTAEYFTKDQVDELGARLEARAKERREFQATLNKQSSDMLSKLMTTHRL